MDVVIEYNDTYHPPQTEQLRRVVLTAGRREGEEGREGERRGRERGGGEGRGRGEGEREGERAVRELQIEKGVTRALHLPSSVLAPTHEFSLMTLHTEAMAEKQLVMLSRVRDEF